MRSASSTSTFGAVAILLTTALQRTVNNRATSTKYTCIIRDPTKVIGNVGNRGPLICMQSRAATLVTSAARRPGSLLRWSPASADVSNRIRSYNEKLGYLL